MSKNKKRLSSTQIWVLELMNDGWELGHGKGFSPSVWIQENGVGKGGKSHRLSIATFAVLCEMKAIELSSTNYPTDKYKITESAKELFK